MSINRTTQSLLAALGVLAAAFGVAEANRPAATAAATGSAVRTVVQSSSLVCPPTLQGVTGSTGYAIAAPGAPSGSAAGSGASGSGASATLARLPGPDGAPGQTVATVGGAGGGTTAKAASGAAAPALVADAAGALAPGLTVQQTTTVTQAVDGRGLSGTACTPTGTDFWFAGASAAKGRKDVLELTDTETTAADVDVQLIGPDGEAENTTAVGISVAPGSTTALQIAGLVTGGVDGTDLAVHVSVRNGRVAAALHAENGTNGSDWLPATAEATTAVVPGLPGDLTDARLVVADPGGSDADLQIQLASQTGWITPAGHETVHVKAGTVSAVDLGNVTRGEPAALRLTPTSGSPAVPVVAGVEVTRGSAANGTDTAFLAGSAPLGSRATAAGSSGGDSTLLLTSAGAAATVQLSAYATGSPVTKSVSVPAGGTVALAVPQPSGGGSYAVSVRPVSGGPVYAARMISRTSGGIPMFTIQQLSDDRSTVLVPHAAQDPTIVLR